MLVRQLRSNCVLISLSQLPIKKARGISTDLLKKMERVKRFELSTSTLARSRSTTELHPQVRELFAIVRDQRQDFFEKKMHLFLRCMVFQLP